MPLPDPLDEQLEAVTATVADAIGPVIVGAYLYGSAVAGGLRPDSDLDIFVLVSRSTTRDERQSLVDRIRPLSDRDARPSRWRPVELSVVVESDVVPWRYPPRLDFQYGEWLRDDFWAGRIDPSTPVNPDVAVLLTMVRLRSRPLVGPRAAELLEPVPREDLVRAIVAELEPLLADLEADTRNVLLTLARMWGTVSDGEIRSKDEAADWAVARLPEGHRPLLARARDGYVRGGGDAREDPGAVRRLAERLASEIRRRSGPGRVGPNGA